MSEGREPINREDPVYRPIPRDAAPQARAHMPELPVDARQGNFNEVELGYDEPAGKDEAHRCLNCGYCCECYQCVEPAVPRPLPSTPMPSNPKPRNWRSAP